MNTAYERLTDRLRDLNKIVKTNGRLNQAKAQCPHHDDHNPSLVITQVEGKVLMHCHAGCHTDDILTAINWTKADLYDNQLGADYLYSDGRVAHRRYDGDGKKRFSQSGTKHERTVLYKIDKVKAAVAQGQGVYLVEGEDDADTIESVGGVATTAPQGARSFHKVDASPLHGAHVQAVVDKDASGQGWARQVYDKLSGKAASLEFVQAKIGKDASDHVAAELSLDEFEPIAIEGTQPARKARITWADEIEPAPVQWAWKNGDEGRIPSGSLSIAAGREGTGKSSFGISLCAQITNGTLPGCFYGKPRRVLYLAVEDSWKYTLVPRLIAAGADRSKVGRFDVITDEGDEVVLALPYDNSLLERSIVENEIALVVIDPIMSVITQNIDTHRTHEVRQALDPLAKLADRTGCVILGIAHFNKAGGTDAATLLSGSHAFRDVPRSIFGFARDDTDSSRVMTQVKNSLGRDDLPSLTYTMESTVVDTKLGPAETAIFVFGGESERSVADVLRDSRRDSEDLEQRRDAASWIKDYLAQVGGKAEVKDVIAAGKAVGYAEQTLKNVRRKVADTDQSGFGKDQVHTWILRTDTARDTRGTGNEYPVSQVSQSVPVQPDDELCPSCAQHFARPNPSCSLAAYHGPVEEETL